MTSSWYLGLGGPSYSSSSNLSALAPPFTFGRSNPKPDFNPIWHVDSSYGNTWQYPHPSAPGPDLLSRTELEVDSSATHVPLPDDYRYSTAGPVLSSGNWSGASPSSSTLYSPCTDVNSYYYPSYLHPEVSKDTPFVIHEEPSYDSLPSPSLASVGVSSPADYTQSLSGLKYSVAPWDSSWNGFFDRKLGEQVEVGRVGFSPEKPNGNGSYICNSYVNQEGPARECGSIHDKHPGTSFGEYTFSAGSEKVIGSSSTVNINDKSNMSQNPVRFSLESTSFPEASLLGPSIDLYENLISQQKPYNSYEKCIQPLNSCASDDVLVKKSHPDVVIRPPPASSSSLAQKAPSCWIVDTNMKEGYTTTMPAQVMTPARNANSGITSLVKGKELHLPVNTNMKEGYITTMPVNSTEGSNHVSSMSFSEEAEQSYKDNAKGALHHSFKEGGECQIPTENTNDFLLAIACGQPAKNSESSFDCLNYHNSNVDSPCWRGAPASHLSRVDVVGDASPHQFIKKLEDSGDLSRQRNRIAVPFRDSISGFVENPCQDNATSANSCTEEGTCLPSDNARDSSCLTKMSNTSETELGYPRNSGRIEFLDELNKPTGEYETAKKLNGDSEITSGFKQVHVREDKLAAMKLKLGEGVDSEMNLNDATDGGIVAFHAAEHVLHSPASTEDSAEHAQAGRMKSGQQIDVKTVVNTMLNLSDLLLFHFSSESVLLKEQDHQVLNQVMNNLASCISKKREPTTPGEEPAFSLQNTDNLEGLHDLQTSTFEHQHKLIQRENSHYQNCHQQLHEAIDESNDTGKRVNTLSSPGDGVDNSGEDIMVKAIKKVLDENFHLDEELHPQALQFKDLWLEAEAKLCSIGYRARFDRMKNEMGKQNSSRAKEISKGAAVPENSSSYNVPLNLDATSMPELKAEDPANLNTVVQNSVSSGVTDNSEDVEASVIARFNILKSRDNSKPINIEPQQPVGAGFSTKRNLSPPTIQNQFGFGSLNTTREPDPVHFWNASEGGFIPSMNGFGKDAAKFLFTEMNGEASFWNNNHLANQLSSRLSENSSSDWEQI